MQSTGTLMSVSSAIAEFQHLELVLAVTFIGWVSVAWVTRKRQKDG